MFSGIIEQLGTVLAIERAGSGARIVIGLESDGLRLALGESIATNGVCLTVTQRTEHSYGADLSPETLQRTTLGGLKPGDRVNLERSLCMGDRISGHFVFGHVDGVGEVVSVIPETIGFRLRVRAPAALSGFLVDKGSIAVDGISLTMCDCAADTFDVAVVPHTAAATTLGAVRPGARVNLEADMLARYAKRAVETLR